VVVMEVVEVGMDPRLEVRASVATLDLEAAAEDTEGAMAAVTGAGGEVLADAPTLAHEFSRPSSLLRSWYVFPAPRPQTEIRKTQKK